MSGTNALQSNPRLREQAQTVALAGPALQALGARAGDEDSQWSILEFHGRETMNALFDYRLRVQHPDASLDLRLMLGRELQVWLSCGGASSDGMSRELRCIAGVVTELEHVGHDEREGGGDIAGVRALLRLRAWPWLADMQVASRVHQHRSVVEVIQRLLACYGFAWEMRLQGSYPKLDYFVQFDETDWEFLRRQCARWGMHLHFEHGVAGHCLVIGDGEHAMRDQPLASCACLELRVHGRAGDAEGLHAWCAEAAQGVEAFASSSQPECHPQALRRWCTDVPDSSGAHSSIVRWRGVDGVFVPRRSLDTVPDNPGDASDESRLHRTRWLQARRGLRRVRGSGPLPGLAAGYRLRLLLADAAIEGPPQGRAAPSPPPGGVEETWGGPAFPRDLHFVHSARISMRMLPGEDADPIIPLRIEFDARLLADGVDPMPPCARTRMLGTHTATVLEARRDEPDGTAFADPVGRLRVRMHWAHGDERASTCWLRMARPAAGDRLGCATWPRPGQEVLVEYLDGDPDAPICVGSVRNPANTPPWPLPGAAAVSGWYSHELRPGEENAADSTGNHLLFDDHAEGLQVQLASCSDASALHLGRHAPVDRQTGRCAVRGEGFELRTEGGSVLRAARTLSLISAAAAEAAQSILQPLRICRRRLQGALDRHASQRIERDARVDLPPGPDLALRRDLEQCDASLTLRAEGNLLATSAEDVVLAAGGHLLCAAQGDLGVACRNGLHVHAQGAAVLSSVEQGIDLVASEGHVRVMAASDELQFHARDALQLMSARRSVHLVGSGRMILQAAGQEVVMGPDGIRHACRGAWRVRAARRTLSGAVKSTSPEV